MLPGSSPSSRPVRTWVRTALLLFPMLLGGEQTAQEPPSLAADGLQQSNRRHPAGQRWVIDPSEPGPDLPPVGRSLFDYLVSDAASGGARYAVPFPFTALVQRIERELAPAAHGSPLKRVLIPLNRSLQRDAAAPEFFRFPRAVVGVDSDPLPRAGVAGMYLKDRLFLGYQEKAQVLEVISYNEAAGRFEFQVVRDYGPGKTPQVFYANRALCTACHQNHAPVFSRPLWDETNANPAIAARLDTERADFYGFPVHQGIDVPNALDDATDRANLFSAYQLLWQEGCERAGQPDRSVACRADVFRFLLHARLSGSVSGPARLPSYRSTFLPEFVQAWTANWPQGLRIPNPDLPNRRPIGIDGPSAMAADQTLSADRYGVVGSPAIRSLFEPTLMREPLEIWTVSLGRHEAVARFMAGLSQFIPDVDVERLDHALLRRAAAAAPVHRYGSACQAEVRQAGRSVDRLLLQCRAAPGATPAEEGGFSMEGVLYVNGGTITHGTIDKLETNEGDDFVDLHVVGGTFAVSGDRYRGRFEVRQRQPNLHVRLGRGEAIKEVRYQFAMPAKRSAIGREGVDGSAVLSVLQDAEPIERAIDRMARETLGGESDVFARRPFRRASLMKTLYRLLNMPSVAWCCEEVRGMPDPVAADGAAHERATNVHDATGSPAARAFHRYCAQCHHEDVPFPPNFLHGPPEQVQAQLQHCAERIFFRLKMWGLPDQERPEAPMPPATALGRLHMTPQEWISQADFALLTSYSTDFIASQTGKPPRLEELAIKGYDRLRTCLPSHGPDGAAMPAHAANPAG